MANSALGTFSFQAFHRPGDPKAGPEILAEQVSVLARAGTDGAHVRREGRKGDVFQMESTVFVINNTAVLNLIGNYNAARGLIATLSWEGVDYTTIYGCAYAVLRVQNIRVDRVGAGISGNVNITGWYMVRATWDLIAVDVALLSGGSGGS